MDGSDPYLYVYKPEDGTPQTNFKRVETEVAVHDLRALKDDFNLKEKGIELHKLVIPSDIDWSNEKEVHPAIHS